MNLKQLAYFVQVAELGSFSKAARLLGVAQPALSRQVRQLETDLHETLLLRNGRGVALTDAGQRLFAHGTHILQAVAQAEHEMGALRDEPVGRITIGLPPSVGRQLSLPLIEQFRRQLPRARLAIIDLVCAGHGHAVLHASAVTASGRSDQLQVRPLEAPRLATVLCQAVSANKRPSPLMRRAMPLLAELVRGLPQAAAAQSRPG